MTIDHDHSNDNRAYHKLSPGSKDSVERHSENERPDINDEADDQPSASRLQAPEWIQNLSREERLRAETNLKRKVDLRLLPMIILIYIMNYIDRNNIAAAKLAGIVEDLDLKGVQYQTSVSILFVGYLLMQVPSNLFLNNFGKPAIYLPICMIIWGFLSTVTAACQNYAGLVTCRFFLGFVEAAYFPGCLYYLSTWYTRQELGLRTAMLYSGALISGAFSGLIAAGVIANLDGARGLAAWRWLFIIEGTITIFIAVSAFWVLPNFPRTTAWLTEEERQLAVWRLEEDIGDDDWVDSAHQSSKVGAKLAFTDVKIYVLMVLLFGIVAAGSVTNFFPTVVKTLDYGNIETLLLTAPPYVFTVIVAFANAWHADKSGERFFHISIPLCVAVAAFILAATTTATAPRYVAMMFMLPGIYGGYVVALAWISNSIPRPPSKRAAALAFINAVSNSSSIYASYMYPDSASPRFVAAMGVNCGMCAMAICAAVGLRIILVRLNEKLDQGILVEGAINSGTIAAERKGFRFKV